MTSPRLKVAIVGAGIYGLCIADHLADLGARVSVFDDGHAEAKLNGSSRESRLFRLTTLEDPAYLPLARYGQRYFDDLSGGEPLLLRTGFALIAEPGARGQRHHSARAVVDRATEVAEDGNIAHRVMVGSEFRRQFPTVEIDRDSRVFFEESAGILLVDDIYTSLIARLRTRGSRLYLNDHVQRISPNPQGVLLELDEASLPFDHVVLATGAGALGQHPRARVIPQPVAWFEQPVSVGFPPLVVTRANRPLLFGFPEVVSGRGAKFVQENETPPRRVDVSDTDARIDSWAESLAQTLPAAVHQVVPALGSRTEQGWQYYVAMPSSRMTVDFMPGVTRISCCSGHGYKLAPGIAELVARRVMGLPTNVSRLR